MKKLFSMLLALVLALGVIAVAPISASAAIEAGNAAALAEALDNAASGDTIKLTADITYNDWICIAGKSITFDLNGKTLTATGGIAADSGGNILLADPNNGAFNVTFTSESDDSPVISFPGSTIEVTNVNCAGALCYALLAEDSGEIVVYDRPAERPGRLGAVG